ncbi:MAG TPA: hypothetical protein DCZ48_13485 [Methylococcaceae bacterium]|nr:hypothetical protein [Methylococcaceae bacterium]
MRLDPKLRYLTEIAARKHRRTISSFIEWAVEASLRDVRLYQGTGYQGDEDITVEDESKDLWDIDESERFARLAIKYPELLTHQEQEIWKLLSDSGLMSPARSRNHNGTVFWSWGILEDTVFPKLRRYWSELLDAYSEGAESSRKWVDKIESEIASGKIYSADQTKGTSNDDDLDLPF